MRFHRRYPFLQIWLSRPECRELIRAERLSVARFEPTMQLMSGGGILDLIFSDGAKIAAVPFVEITPMFLLQRGGSALMWPYACRALGFDMLHAIEAEVLPWLQSLTLARALNSEVVRRFSQPLPEGVFDSARALSLLAAAPYDGVLLDAAPYAYAIRFSHGRRVRVCDARGGTGAALLAPLASAAHADLGSDEANATARTWFGADLFGNAALECDVAVGATPQSCMEATTRIVLREWAPDAHEVRVAQPVATDVMFSFEPEDSAPARAFGVVAPAEPALRQRAESDVTAAGGSSGRILLLVRESWNGLPDADSDEACALAERLAGEGFTVRIASAAEALRANEPADLVHCLTLHHAAEMLEAVKRYGESGVPIVATAALPQVLNDTVGTPHLIRTACALGDEAAILDRLDLLDLHARQAQFTEAEPREGYGHAIRSLLSHVNAVLVNGETEERALRDRYAYRGAICRVHPLAASAPPERIGHLTGVREFVLVHAPIEARANLPLLARAAAECGVALVAAGPTVEPDVCRSAREALCGDFIHIPSPSPGQLESLYRAASWYVDVSWMPYGLSRIARAVACGAKALVSDRSHARSVWPGMAMVSPGSMTALRGALRAAGNTVPVAASAREAFLAVIAAYDQAQRAGVRA